MLRTYGSVANGADAKEDIEKSSPAPSVAVVHLPMEKPSSPPESVCERLTACLRSRDGWPWIVVVGVAASILAIPRPETVSFEGWTLLAIFIATIVAAVVQPGGLGLGPLCIMAVTVACGTGCLTINGALKDLGSKSMWLVVMAFFIARAITKSRLGPRIARRLASFAGANNPLALAYCFLVSELILAPMIPSVTARTGSIIYPLVYSAAVERDPDGSRRIASFLTLCCFQVSAVTSAMFVTAMAGNPIVQAFANNYLQNDISMLDDDTQSLTAFNWMLGAIAPGLLSLILVPLTIYVLHPPLSQDPWLVSRTNANAKAGHLPLDAKGVDRLISDAGETRVKSLLFRATLREVIQKYGDVEGRARARAEAHLGGDWANGSSPASAAHNSPSAGKQQQQQQSGRPWSRDEVYTLVTVVLMLLGWMGQGKIPGLMAMDATTVAFAGVSLLILSRVLLWKDVVTESAAWNTLVWLAILSGLASSLKDMGVIGYFSGKIAGFFASANFEPHTGFSILSAIYVYSHYLFASCSAHMISMYMAFLGVATDLGVKPLGAALMLGYVSNIMGGLTHYATGAAPVLFGKGFVELGEWWRIGFVVSLVNLVNFLLIGRVWLKFLDYL